MHIIVIGAGVVGMATALRLAQDGHTVEVLDSAERPASGASFANAGLISPGHCFSWAEPGVFSMLLRALVGGVDGFGVAQPLSPALWRWGLQFVRQSTRSRWLANSRAALRLSAYSRNLHLQSLLPATAYGGRTAGILYCYGPDHAPNPAELQMLRDAGEPFERLAREELARYEPALGPSLGTQFGSGLYCAQDATGDARDYARAACAAAQALGVTMRFEAAVQSLLVSGRRVSGVQTRSGPRPADAVVMAAGAASPALLQPLGYRLPIYPVTGYSVTYDDPALQPMLRGGVSIVHKIAWAPLGEHVVRMTGFADVGVPSARMVARRFADLEAFATQLMPALGGFSAQRWVGQRPMTPDGIPILGPTCHEGLFLNCGHGAMGWTMASGSAQVLAHQIVGRTPDIDATDYGVSRFR